MSSTAKPLPLLNPKIWAIAFLIFAIALTALFAATMPEFFKHAFEHAS